MYSFIFILFSTITQFSSSPCIPLDLLSSYHPIILLVYHVTHYPFSSLLSPLSSLFSPLSFCLFSSLFLSPLSSRLSSFSSPLLSSFFSFLFFSFPSFCFYSLSFFIFRLSFYRLISLWFNSLAPPFPRTLLIPAFITRKQVEPFYILNCSLCLLL